MMDVNDYLLRYKRRTPKILIIWFLIFTFIIISFLIINRYFSINNYYRIQGVIENKNINLYLNINDLKKISKLDTLYINNQKYNYKIKTISENIIVGNSFYKEIKLNINLDDLYLIDNNIVDIQFIVSKMTIFEYIVNLVKGE